MTTPTQAVVLAAGISRRLVPFNLTQNKAELELMGRPLLTWTIQALQANGVRNLTVVVNPQMELDSDYWQQWANQFEEIQVVEQLISNGQAGALVAALPTLNSDFYVVNATHATADELISQLEHLESEVAFLTSPTDLTGQYGLVDFDQETGLVRSVAEKPTDDVGRGYRLVGVYRLTREFVTQLAKTVLDDSALETTLSNWAAQGRVRTSVCAQEPPSLKYSWQLLDFKEYLWQKLEYVIDPTAIIAPTAIIRGEVAIGPGAVIGDFAIIDGPAYIGPGAVVGQHCIVRKGCVLEAGAQIQRHGDVANSILMADVHIHSGFIGDSIIGPRTTIGAGFTTANRRFDRGEITAHVRGKKVRTGRTYLGAMIGADCKIGIKVGTMPNVVITAKNCIEPGTIVKRNVGV